MKSIMDELYEESYEKAYEKAFEEGRRQVRMQTTIELAQGLTRADVSDEIIMKVLEITEKELEEIRKMPAANGKDPV